MMREPPQRRQRHCGGGLPSSPPTPLRRKKKRSYLTGGGSRLTGGCFYRNPRCDQRINSSAQHLRPPFLSAVSATHNEKQVLCDLPRFA
ncbi:hypothetical protein HanHA89_Chr01g0011301 [Helianthus annuus]|nr:hypothetical protein HanHA89_Chr01g0011301 [Helianthus annuus]